MILFNINNKTVITTYIVDMRCTFEIKKTTTIPVESSFLKYFILFSDVCVF